MRQFDGRFIGLVVVLSCCLEIIIFEFERLNKKKEKVVGHEICSEDVSSNFNSLN